jgi:hypothetical protein
MKQLLLIAAFAAANTLVASAEPSESTSVAKVPIARRMYDEGVDAADKGRWVFAYDRFKASYELSPRVLTLFNLACAQAQTGRPIEATESYRRFLRETSDGRYPDLRTAATTQLELVGKQVAQLTLEIANGEPGDAVTIDEIEFPQAALREPIALDPGSHVAAVHRGETALATRTITLAPGATEAVRLEVPNRPVDLVVHKPVEAPSPAGVALDTRPVPEAPRRSVLRSPWLWSAAAVVVAGSVTAAYLLTRSDGDVLVVR